MSCGVEHESLVVSDIAEAELVGESFPLTPGSDFGQTKLRACFLDHSRVAAPARAISLGAMSTALWELLLFPPPSEAEEVWQSKGDRQACPKSQPS
jgi:hypothetical protein